MAVSFSIGFLSVIEVIFQFQLRVAWSHPRVEHRFMEPMRRGRKNMSVLIGDRLASFIAWQARVHAQKHMFVTLVWDFGGIETGRANIEEQRGVHLFRLFHIELSY